MGNDLIKSNSEKNFQIETKGDVTYVKKIKQNTEFYKSAEISQQPSPKLFKKLDVETKKDILNGMIEDGKSRPEIAFTLGISESRISQIIGKKRKTKTVYIDFGE